ncbi:MAG TPA: hypothetical protein VFE24_05915 [Pirellulales bacterium]|nr:hypothetical protein [Pirellulales bacterium]
MTSCRKLKLRRVAFTSAALLLALTCVSAAADQNSASHDALEALQKQLAQPGVKPAAIESQAFAKVALTKEDAAAAKKLLWDYHAAEITKDRAEEIKNGLVKYEKMEMPFTIQEFGKEPEAGWSLWFSLHGGGGAPKQVNDQQYENQKRLYKLQEGLYLVPRAPTNTWNLWHESHIDHLFDRLIEDLIVLKHVDPNRVYVMGYSAGGDGVYQLGPRMADRWAAAAMMAGHPNDASPLSLRNVAFAIQVGALDAAYDRNKIAQKWIDRLDELEKADPKGYVHFSKIHAGKSHWMDLEDAKVLPWMAAKTRNPVPDRVVWMQNTTVHDRSYWLAVPKADPSLAGKAVTVDRDHNLFTIKSCDPIGPLLIHVDDRMIDFDQPVKVVFDQKTLFDQKLPRTIATLEKTLAQRGDPDLVFSGEVNVTAVEAKPAEEKKADEKKPDEKKVEKQAEAKK